MVECSTPSHPPGEIRLRLSGDFAAAVDGSGASFVFLPDIEIVDIYPTEGAAVGGTQVILTLSRAVGTTTTASPMCKFGVNSVEATRVSSTKLLCHSSAETRGQRVPIAVAWSDNDIVTSDVAFTYYSSRKILEIDPAVGSVGGQVTVTIRLNEPPSSGDYSCGFEFGDMVQLLTSARLSTSGDSVTCSTPNGVERPGRALVSVWMNGERVSTNSQVYEFITTPEVSLITPSLVPESGGSTVRIIGSGFNRRHRMMCRVADIEISATVISSEVIECVSPSLAPGTYSLAITWNSQEFVESPSAFDVFEVVSVVSITPLQGPKSAQTEVRVFGSGFKAASELVCRFGAIITPAFIISRREISCMIPMIEPSAKRWGSATVAVEVNLDGTIFYGSAVAEFSFYDPPVAQRVFPSAGSVRGHAVLSLDGTYDPILQYECAFETGELVPATVVNSTLVRCSSPAVTHTMKVRLGVRVVGESHSPQQASVYYRYFDHPVVSELSPAVVRARGGDTILVTGRFFTGSKAAQCRFGETTLSQATIVSDTTMSCAVPSRTSGSGYGLVEITLNGVDFTDNGLVLYYRDNLDVARASPDVIRAAGGAPVLVMLSEQVTKDALYECLFIRATETLVVPAHVVGSNQLNCLSPKWSPGVASVGVWLSRSTCVESDVSVELVADPIISSIEPPHGPISGGGVVTVAGDNLDHVRVACVFGNVSIAPLVVTQSHLECVVPSYDAAKSVEDNVHAGMTTSTLLRAVVGDSVQSDLVEYFYDERVTIWSVASRQIPEQGGWMLAIAGDNFIDAPELGCRFGGHDLGTKVSAIFVNRSYIQCQIPAGRPSTVHLGVTMNGRDYVYYSKSLQYELDVYVDSISPATGSVNGGTVVRLVLRNAEVWALSNTAPYCLFGDIEARAILLNESSASCISPGTDEPSSVAVSFFWRQSDSFERLAAAISSTAIMFGYEIDPVLTDLMPAIGSEGSLLTIYGDNLKRDVLIRFGLGDDAQYARPHLVSPTQVGVILPGGLGDGVVSVAVTQNLADYSNALTFLYQARPTLLSVFPTVIVRRSFNDSSLNNTDLLITGRGFTVSMKETLLCQVGEDTQMMTAEWVSDTQIMCQSVPSLSPGQYTVKVSVNGGADFVDDAVKVVNREELMIHGLSPTFGSIEGNTRVRVLLSSDSPLGDALDDGLACIFGRETSPLRVITAKGDGEATNSSYAECNSPQRSKVGSVAFAIGEAKSQQNVATSGTAFTFTYVKAPQIRHVTPGIISERTPLLRVTGSHFLDSPLLACRVGSVVLDARFVSTSLVECYLDKRVGEIFSPGWTVGDSLRIDVTSNGLDFTNSEVELLAVAPIRLTRIEPTTGAIRRVTRVKIFGDGFPALHRGALSCIVGETSVSRAIFITEQWIECELPAVDSPSILQISVAADGTYYTSDSIAFRIQDVPVAHSLLPTIGPHRGGTPVTIRGEGFQQAGGEQSNDLACLFGSSVVVARVLDTRTAECVASPHLSGTAESVHVYVTKLSPSTLIPPPSDDTVRLSDLLFSYINLPVVVAIDPASGLASGGTLVRVQTTGTGLGDKAWCRFGVDAIIQGTRALVPGSGDEDSTEILCQSPPFPGSTGRVYLEVSGNGWDFSESQFEFTVDSVPTITKLSPQYGPLSGANTVTVRGQGFVVGSPTVECDFGGARVPAQVRTPQKLECTAPPIISYGHRAEVHEVVIRPLISPESQLQLDALDSSLSMPKIFLGFDGTQTASGLPLTASVAEIGQILTSETSAQVSSVEVFTRTEMDGVNPYTVLVWKITLPLAAYVRRLENICELLTIEASVPNSFRFGVTVTTQKTSTACTAMRVYTNGQDAAAGELAYAYLAVPRVLSVEPSSGPLTGGTNLSVHGSNFLAGPDLACVLGDYHTSANFVGESEIWCLSPPQEFAGTVFIKVMAFNAAKMGKEVVSMSAATFQYHPPLVFASMTPAHGPNTGGTRVRIAASGVVDVTALSCVFTVTTPSIQDGTRVVVAAKYHSSELLSCVTPSLAGLIRLSSANWSDSARGTAWISVSNNGVDFVSTGSSFDYVPPIRSHLYRRHWVRTVEELLSR